MIKAPIDINTASSTIDHAKDGKKEVQASRRAASEAASAEAKRLQTQQFPH